MAAIVSRVGAEPRDEWHGDTIYRGLGCGGGFGTPVVS